MERRVHVTVKDRWNGHLKGVTVTVEADQYDSDSEIKESAIQQIDESKYEVLDATTL